MKKIVFLSVILLIMMGVRAQKADTLVKGNISYLTSQNVYVKFQSTRGIKTGDTLLIDQNGKPTPALVVRSLSSMSCVCEH